MEDKVFKVMKHITTKDVAKRYTLGGTGLRQKFEKYTNIVFCIKGKIKMVIYFLVFSLLTSL